MKPIFPLEVDLSLLFATLTLTPTLTLTLTLGGFGLAEVAVEADHRRTERRWAELICSKNA